jgi:N-acetylmuramoyl-L-alanine amidase
MPGVLIELGFLSNAEEGEFLNSEEGQTKMAHQIAEAIVKYKRDYFSEPYAYDENKVAEKLPKFEPKAPKIEPKVEPKESKVEPVVVKTEPKIEAKEVKVDSKEIKTEAKVTKTVSKDTLEAKVVDEEPILATATDEGMYKIQLFASSKKKDLSSPDFKGLKDISLTYEHNLYKYYYSKSIDLEGAKKSCQEAKKHGFKDAFIVIFSAGKGIPLK